MAEELTVDKPGSSAPRRGARRQRKLRSCAVGRWRPYDRQADHLFVEAVLGVTRTAGVRRDRVLDRRTESRKLRIRIANGQAQAQACAEEQNGERAAVYASLEHQL